MLVTVKNPTTLPRNGYVSIPWLDLTGDKVSPDAHVIVEYNGRRLPKAQVDRITISDDPDADDRSLWELCVYVDYMDAGGYEEAVPIHLDVHFTASIYSSCPWPVPLPRVRLEKGGQGVTLEGERLVAHLRFPAGPAPDYNYQGGAFTSIRLVNREILDAFKAEEHPSAGHDVEKRLQLDRVVLPNDAFSGSPTTEVKLFDRDWRFVSCGQGSARAWVVIESPVIDYSTFTGHLYRVISLYSEADYLMEDVFVIGTPKGEGKGEPRRVSFAPHYFLKMDFGKPPHMNILRVPQIPDWFTIATYHPPNQAYGFAASVAAGRIDNPPRDYPRENKHSAFGWECGFTSDRVRCMHLFARRIDPREAADETGRKWYDLLFKPPEVCEITDALPPPRPGRQALF